jgi:NAD(P)-dependent dehydrogenase (short-subunit alcohol dehydrogenase family)
MSLKNKVAIVTGAAQGIGAAYAEGLAAAGAAVAVCDVLDARPFAEKMTAGGAKVIHDKVDITDPEAVGDFVKRVTSELGGLHVLVNNAALFGTLSRTPMEDISSADWDRVMVVNTRGTFECIKAVVPTMRAQGYGKIVNIASTTVASGAPLLLHYVASKGAIVAMTRSLARELGAAGIRVNCISPGFTLSEAVKSNPRYTSEIVQSIASMRALKRDQLPADLVDTVLFLSSAGSDFITGQNIIVDGGSHMQ